MKKDRFSALIVSALGDTADILPAARDTKGMTSMVLAIYELSMV
jgi:hypothetical protein